VRLFLDIEVWEQCNQIKAVAHLQDQVVETLVHKWSTFTANRELAEEVGIKK
jgi:hypothetical protein